MKLNLFKKRFNQHQASNTKLGVGFTLVELLMVIAIVLVLTAIVMNSFSISQNKKSDFVVKSELNQALIQAKIYYDKYGNYSDSNGFSSVGTSYTNCSGNNTLFQIGGTRPLDDTESIWRFIWRAQEASDPRYAQTRISNTWVATCGMGFPITYNNGRVQTQSFAVAIPLQEQNIISDTSGTDYYCIDNTLDEGKVIDEVSQMNGDSWGEVASCG